VITEPLYFETNGQTGAYVWLWGTYDVVRLNAVPDHGDQRPLKRSQLNLLRQLDWLLLPEHGIYAGAVQLDPENPHEGWELAGRLAVVTVLDVYAPRDSTLANGAVRFQPVT
jgi:hypothetical protein